MQPNPTQSTSVPSTSATQTAHAQQVAQTQELQSVQQLQPTQSSSQQTHRAPILLVGSAGQLGWHLQRTLAGLGPLVCCSRRELDLTDEAACRRYVQQLRPRIIVNAAAYTAVDRAEQESELAYQINCNAPKALAEELRHWNGLFIHYSTDYVFDGQSRVPYTEEQPIAPLGVYGASKLAGEQALQASSADAFIFRTSWVYSLAGQNFLRTMLRLGKERPKLRIVGDQIGAPTWAKLIAEATAVVISQLETRSLAERSALRGLYNLTAQGETSWFGFAKQILHSDLIQAWLQKAPPELEAITTAEYPLPAKRPSYSVLSHTKFVSTFNWQMPAWEECLKMCLDELSLITRSYSI